MNQHNDILKELEQLSPVLSGISRRNVFSLPDGYFEMLSANLLLQVQSPLLQVDANLKSGVPAGYFDTLADNIMARIRKETDDSYLETNSISSVVADIGRNNIFNVPGGYFETLAIDIAAFIKRERSGNAVNEETREISALVAGIGNNNVYGVPEGYFENLDQSLEKVTTKPAKLVSMRSRFTAIRYAAAAVITGLIGLSVFFILNKDNTTTHAIPTAAVLTDAKQIIQTNSFDKELSSISDAAIVSYLESKGQDVEAALVASLTDGKDLPEAEDYLINENTLDEVLKTIDLNN